MTPCGLPPGAVSPGAALAGIGNENAHMRLAQVAAAPQVTPVAAGPPDLHPFGSLQLNAGAAAAGQAATPVLTGGEAKTPQFARGSGGGGAAAVDGLGGTPAATFAFPGIATPGTGRAASVRPSRAVRTPVLHKGVVQAQRSAGRSGAGKAKSHPLALEPPASLMYDPQDVCRIQTMGDD